MRISVDVGYGYVKAVNEKGKKVTFPSIVAPSFTKGIGNVLGGSKDDYAVVMWPFGRPGESSCYYVGDRAMTSGGAVRTWEENAAENTNIIIFILTALALLNDDSTIELAVGLPMEYFDKQNQEIKEALSSIDYSVNVEGGKGTKRIKINSVFVFPQGAGAYYAACLSPDGTVKNPDIINQAVGIIDIGYRTTDYLVMAKGKKGIAPREDLTGSLEIGMNEAHQNVQKEVEKLVGKQVDLLKIEQAILWNGGKFTFKGQEFVLNDYIEKSYEALSQRITSKIKIIWGDEIDHLSIIYIAGGGVKVLYSYLHDAFEMCDALDTFANAEGYLAAQALKSKCNIANS